MRAHFLTSLFGFFVLSSLIQASEYSVLKKELEATSFIIPNNDGESRAAVEFLRSVVSSVPVDLRVSEQKWGATLDKEPAKTFEKLKKRVVVFEMPSPKKEAELRALGHDVVVLDHHNYPSMNLDRTSDLSSLEQLFNLILPSPQPINNWFYRAVALNDHSYIYGMLIAGLTSDQIRTVRRYDLEAQGFTTEMLLVSGSAFAQRKSAPGLTVVELPITKTAYVSDLFVLENKGKVDNLLIVSRNAAGKITELNFSGYPSIVGVLSANHGGWAGGDKTKSMFWGKSFKPEEKPEEVLKAAKNIIIKDCTGRLAAL